jgi:hypothetical protein
MNLQSGSIKKQKHGKVYIWLIGLALRWDIFGTDGWAKGNVSEDQFSESVAAAENVGFVSGVLSKKVGSQASCRFTPYRIRCSVGCRKTSSCRWGPQFVMFLGGKRVGDYYGITVSPTEHIYTGCKPIGDSW